MLKTVEIKGFKSIRNQSVGFGRINVIIGANGSGKTNLISFFRMLGSVVSGRLQLHIGQAGGADDLLFYSSRVTSRVEGRLIFSTDDETGFYHICLVPAGRDTLIFSDEQVSLSENGSKMLPSSLGSGHRESALPDISGQTSRVILNMMSQCRCFQFHDTSDTAKVRQFGYIEDNQYLKSDAGNLAAFLFMLRESNRPCYRRIVSTLRLTIPFFDDLFWREEN